MCLQCNARNLKTADPDNFDIYMYLFLFWARVCVHMYVYVCYQIQAWQSPTSSNNVNVHLQRLLLLRAKKQVHMRPGQFDNSEHVQGDQGAKCKTSVVQVAPEVGTSEVLLRAADISTVEEAEADISTAEEPEVYASTSTFAAPLLLQTGCLKECLSRTHTYTCYGCTYVYIYRLCTILYMLYCLYCFVYVLKYI